MKEQQPSVEEILRAAEAARHKFSACDGQVGGIVSPLLTKPGFSKVAFHKDGECKTAAAFGDGRTVAVWQAGQRSPMCIDIWNAEWNEKGTLAEFAKSREPDWEFEFQCRMPDNPAATHLAVVIKSRGPIIVEEAVKLYTNPGTLITETYRANLEQELARAVRYATRGK